MPDKSKIYNNHLCVLSDLSELLHIREFVRQKAEDFGFGEEEAYKISLAVDEACSNLIRYAYNFAKDKEICINIESNENQFIVNILDTGEPFNPLVIPETDMKEYFEKFKRGGLGIQIMRKVMDEIAYTPSHGGDTFNSLRLKKNLSYTVLT